MSGPGRRVLLAVGLLVVLVAGLGVAGRYLWLPAWRPDVREGERYAIDVSAHQGQIDWAAVRGDGVGLAYVKATEGRDFVDGRFAVNFEQATRAGMTTGAYHFFTLCSPGLEQAEHFQRVASQVRGLPPAVDLELAGNCAARPHTDEVRRELETFLTAVEQATGRATVLYVGEDWQARYGVPQNTARPLWIRRLILRPRGDSASWTVWQASGYARVDGVEGDVDLNVVRPGL